MTCVWRAAIMNHEPEDSNAEGPVETRRWMMPVVYVLRLDESLHEAGYDP